MALPDTTPSPSPSRAATRRVAAVVVALSAALLGLTAVATPAGAITKLDVIAQQAPPAPTPAPAATAAAPVASAPGTFPNLPLNSGVGRRVVYSNSGQRVWMVEADGGISRSYRVSGRQGVPRPGSYSVFSKSRHTRSGSVTMQYMVRFARGRSLAIGFHSIPVNRVGHPIQGLGELGLFRSAGCVRQAITDAAVLYEWAPVGTPVIVTP